MRRFVLATLRAYKRILSPLLGAHCRFHPTCSVYAHDAVERFGVVRGGTLAAFRVLRCNPLCDGGSDPVPDIFPRRPWRRSSPDDP